VEVRTLEQLRASRSRGTWLGRHSRELLRPFPLPGRYLGHFPIGSPREAQAFSRPKVWDIYEYVRRAGGRGVSADEISESLDVPRTDTYNALKALAHLGYLFISPRDRRSRGERKRRYVCEKIPWSKYLIEKEVVSSLADSDAVRSQVENLKGFLFNGLLQVYDAMAKDHKDLLPLPSQERFCPKCGTSHEALEFFHAIVIGLLSAAMDDTEAFREFLSLLGSSR
jgi:hypothetical protein